MASSIQMTRICWLVALIACGNPHAHIGDGGTGGDDDAMGDDSGGGGGHDAGGGGGSDAGVGSDGGTTVACATLPVCAHAFGSGVDGAALAVAVDSHDNVYIAGLSENDLVFGSHTLFQLGTRDAFVVSFTSTGSYRWAQRWGGGTTLAGAYGIAVDAADHIYIDGGLFGTADFGGGAIGGSGQFVASFTADGTYRWARADAGSGALAIATNGAQVYSIGRFQNTVTYAPGIVVSALGAEDVVVASFDAATGAARWARSWGTAATDIEGGIVAEPTRIAFTMSSALVGSGEKLIGLTADGADRFVTPLDSSIDLRGLAVDASGTLYNSGLHRGGIDTIDGTPYSMGDNEYIRAFSSDGASLWAWTLPDVPAYTWTGIPVTPPAMDRDGHLVIAGTFMHTLHAGGTPLANGNETVFTASYSAAGVPIESQSFDDHNATQAFEWVQDLAVDSHGQRWIVGQYYGTPDFGDGALPFASEGGVMILATP